MSHMALRVNGQSSLALSNIVSGTPALNDCVKMGAGGAYVYGAAASVNEYAVASVGNTSTAAYTAAGYNGEYAVNAGNVLYLWNMGKAPGARVQTFGSGASVEGPTFNYMWVQTPAAAGWYVISATLNVRAVSGVVGFGFYNGGPWVYLNADSSAHVMSRTIRWVTYQTGAVRHYIAPKTNTASGNNYPANSPGTATISWDITRIG
jgi:hypothetical protein